jgi:flagellar biosynthetic protein FliQ
MTDADVLDIATKALTLAAKLGGPILIAILVTGLVVSLIQAVFQVPDQSITFVPKILVAALVIAIGGAWMLETLVTFVAELWTSIPFLIRG